MTPKFETIYFLQVWTLFHVILHRLTNKMEDSVEFEKKS